MNNQDLEVKILEILKTANYFDMVEAAVAFEPEYKRSTFYKTTKKSLAEVLREAKIYYALQLRDLNSKVQEFINGIELSKISEILDQATEMFTQENNDVLAAAETMKDLKNN